MRPPYFFVFWQAAQTSSTFFHDTSMFKVGSMSSSTTPSRSVVCSSSSTASSSSSACGGSSTRAFFASGGSAAGVVSFFLPLVSAAVEDEFEACPFLEGGACTSSSFLLCGPGVFLVMRTAGSCSRRRGLEEAFILQLLQGLIKSRPGFRRHPLGRHSCHTTSSNTGSRFHTTLDNREVL